MKILPDVGPVYPAAVFVKQFTGPERRDANFGYTDSQAYHRLFSGLTSRALETLHVAKQEPAEHK